MNDDQEFAMFRQPWVLFRVQGSVYALPIAVVEEMVPLDAEAAAAAGSRQMIRYREGVLALVPVESLLGVPVPTGQDAAGRTVVVVVQGTRRLGLVVEQMVGVEPLPRRSSGIMEVAPGLKGADTPVNAIATHADFQEMILCLDPEWLMRRHLPLAS